MMQLNTIDIQNELYADPYFIGVFPIDKINTIKIFRNKKITFIANLQPSNLAGNHWVAVRRNSNNTAEYYDSFGKLPPPEIQHWMMQNASSWIWNSEIFQNKNDTVSCGYLCINFVKNK